MFMVECQECNQIGLLEKKVKLIFSEDLFGFIPGTLLIKVKFINGRSTNLFGSIHWIYTDATETTKNMVEVTQVFLLYMGYLLPVDGLVILPSML